MYDLGIIFEEQRDMRTLRRFEVQDEEKKKKTSYRVRRCLHSSKAVY